MAVSNAQKIAKAKYQQSSRTLIAADVSKAKGEFYRQSAKDLDLSLSMLIQSGIEEFISNHAGEKLSPITQKASAEQKLSASEKKLVEEFNQLPVEVQKHFLNIFRAINESKGGDENGKEK